MIRKQDQLRFLLFQPGSLSRRLVLMTAAWIIPMLMAGGFALDRLLADSLTQGFDIQLRQFLRSSIAAAEIDPTGEVRSTRPLGDQRFFEPYSGLYWQVSAPGKTPFRSRSLWDRALPYDPNIPATEATIRTIKAFGDEELRIVERDAVLPGSDTVFRFAVAVRVNELHQQIADYRRVLIWSLSILAVGLLIMGALLATYGLSPLRQVRRALAQIRSGAATRIDTQKFPPEILPLVEEMNALLEYTEAQAEHARTHAGNLAHALKTPMSVLMNEAQDGNSPALRETVLAQVALMRRHVDHHLARARVLGRRADIRARTPVWPSVLSLKRALERIYIEKNFTVELQGDSTLEFRGERQDLEEMVGNLLDNAAKYGRGRARVTVRKEPNIGSRAFLRIVIEDDGPGIPVEKWNLLFERGVRLDQSSKGTGIGLAIVRDVADIMGGKVWLEQSEDLGGLAVVLLLPRAENAEA